MVEKEFEEADFLWLQSFERGTLSSLGGLARYRDGFEHRMVRFGLWDEAGMQATLQMYTTLMQFEPGLVLPSTYISSIACAPARRGRGYGGACLRYALEHMRDAGQLLTTICPFEFAYYRQFGWEWVNIRRSYRVPSRALRPVPETDSVRAAGKQDRKAIEEVYRRIGRGYRGMAVRDEAEWDLILSDSKSHLSYVYVYEGDEGIEGYLVLRGGGSEETWLPEFIALNIKARQALLGLLSRLHMQAKWFTWQAPEDDGFWSEMFHHDMQTSVGTTLQGRVVDIASALTALKPAPGRKGEFVLGVRDPFASWNDRRWQVSIADGAVNVEPTTAEAQVSMDIQAFSQAFFGALPVSKLRDRQRMEVESEDAFNVLRSLLDGPPMWSNGPF
ncbi:GCN5-related N-acetyltransferase [Fimbriimonas ginsengisoli Gsoil 348]|uniref:GCN5-related N-acetyltransferase n=1 Tax=Fimbriimonas ginsengisoli Gsoil 348 TaxID=661478 RepID=A0A068NSP2_FIMGI|nr:GCN5-related N-acetyltransferase [Fimbriimonas ginsengisoli Gsoil 348]